MKEHLGLSPGAAIDVHSGDKRTVKLKEADFGASTVDAQIVAVAVYNPTTLGGEWMQRPSISIDDLTVSMETWKHYGEKLKENLQDLTGRLRRGAYRARPVRRAYIPKPDGRRRPLGVTVLEDKIVQRATAEVMSAIYEEDFVGFSYGFRVKRSCHDALDALYAGIMMKPVSWVLEADIRGYFDAMDHGWRVRFIEHRIAGQRVVRHIKKWLKAGVLEDGTRTQSEEGVPHGGSISPFLANIYLHYVFDLWADQWRRKQARGEVVIVRYADDFVVGFQYREDAERFQGELRERFLKFNLELQDDKAQLTACLDLYWVIVRAGTAGTVSGAGIDPELAKRAEAIDGETGASRCCMG